MMATMIWLEGIRKTYRLGEVDVPVLKGIDLTIEEGEYVAIMGASGSGKSTLMNIIGCLDRPSAGHYVLEGRNLTTLSNEGLAYIRNQRIGFVFQQFNLLPRSTALENVMLPMVYAGATRRQRRKQAARVLTQVGLGNRLDNRPSQLSGGQQQRVAIARARQSSSFNVGSSANIKAGHPNLSRSHGPLYRTQPPGHYRHHRDP